LTDVLKCLLKQVNGNPHTPGIEPMLLKR